MHLAILMMTVYDYFYPKRKLTTADFLEEDPEANVENSTNTDSLLMGGSAPLRKFKSMADADIYANEPGSLYPFESDDEDEEQNEEEKRREEGYQRMGDTIEGVNTQPEQPGIIGRVWNGASDIVTKYQKRKRALEKHTAENVRQTISGFMENRRQAQAQVTAEREVRMYL